MEDKDGNISGHGTPASDAIVWFLSAKVRPIWLAWRGGRGVKAVVFDLDDTLYPEISFVKSGFRVVAGYLGPRFGFDQEWSTSSFSIF